MGKFLSISAGIFILVFIIITWINGEQTIEPSIYTDGLRLWEISLTILVLNKIDTFFIPKMLDYSELALYSMMLVIMQLYDFAKNSLWNIYSQKYSGENPPNTVDLIKLLVILSCSITLFYLFFAKVILIVLFDGKYLPSTMLVSLFCVLGVLKTLYILPSCYIIGKSSASDMKIFFRLNFVSIFLKISLLLVFCIIFGFGLEGFILSGIIAYIYRLIIGLYVMRRGAYA